MHADTALSKEKQKDPTKDNQSDPTGLFFLSYGCFARNSNNDGFDATCLCSLHTAERSFAAPFCVSVRFL